MSGSKKHFEVERKYRLTDSEYQQLPDILREHGFQHKKDVLENDIFLPVEKKGDMLRIRTEESEHSTSFVLTAKTWIDSHGERERSEREEELSPFVRDMIIEVVERVHPKPLRKLSKKRSLYTSVKSGQNVTVTLDYVENIGKYSGPYMEIEFLVEDNEKIPLFRDKIKDLCKTLLGENRDYVQTSYQEMLGRFLEEGETAAHR